MIEYLKRIEDNRISKNAGKYLRKAAKIIVEESKQVNWDQYLQSLREDHVRKRQLMELLDSLDDKVVMKNWT